MRWPVRVAMIGLVLLVLAVPTWAGSFTPQKGDVVLGLGWQIGAPKDDTDTRQDGLTASVEYFFSPIWSGRVDYFRAEVEKEVEVVTPSPEGVHCDTAVVSMFLEQSESKGLSLAASPHVKNISFPFGLLAVDVPDRNTPAWGGTAGIWIDFWATEHFGVGFGANYQYLQNTAVGEDFLSAVGNLRLKF